VASRVARCFCFLIGLLFSTSTFADVYRWPKPAGFVTIHGKITQQDLAFFSSHSKEFESNQLYLHLDSSGGDVDAAMKIGRIIRSAWASTVIPANAHCYSSCALVFIAGVVRTNFGKLGLHRPYFASAPLSIEQVEKQLPAMRSAVKEYVQEMGVTGSFFERMFNTDPSEIDILEDSEKLVPQTDPTYDEIQASLWARHYGITTSEYRKRFSLKDSCGVKYPDCPEATMWGLPVATYRSRSAKAVAKCGNLWESERQVLLATPKRDRPSLPIWVQHETCVVNAMRALPSWETQPLASPPQAGLPQRLPSWIAPH
jgi:hypothetical protein